MIRLRWRVVVLVALIGAGLWWIGAGGQRRWRSFAGRDPDFDSVRRSQVYRMGLGGSLEFEVVPGATGLRLVSNAVLRFGEATEVPEREILYGLEVELADGRGDVVESRSHHFSARLQLFVDPWTGRSGPDSFLVGPSPGVVADGKVLPLAPLRELAAGGRLRVRTVDPDPVMQGVLIRLYTQTTTSRSDLRSRWYRMSRRERELAARGNLYPAELLTESERRNLLLRPWSPQAPRGVPGADYLREFLYTKEDPGPPVAEDPGRPMGVAAPAGVRLLAEVPAGARAVSLQLLPAELVPSLRAHRPVGAASLLFRPAGAPPGRAVPLPDLPWDDGGASTRRAVPGPGTLEIELPAPAVVGIESDPDGASLEPDPAHLGVDACDDEAVEVPLVALDDRALPLRVTLRGLVAADDGSSGSQPPATREPATVPLVVLDGAGAELTRSDVVHTAALSSWDWADDGENLFRVEEATEHFLSAPPRAALLRVGPCPRRILVAVYNRPPDLTRTLVVELEGRASADVVGEPAPAWFRLSTPRAPGERRAPGLRLQRRPDLASDPPVEPAPFGYDSLEPASGALVRSLLAPRADSGPVAERILGLAYTDLPTGRETALEVGELLGDDRIRPSILYSSPEDGDPAAVTLGVDGVALRTHFLSPGHGSLELGELAGGLHRLRIDAPSGWHFFVNHGVGDAPWIRRTVRRFDAPIELVIEKPTASPLTISGRLFLPAGRSGPAEVRGRLLGAEGRRSGATTGHTFERRVWRFLPGTRPAPWVEGGATLRLDQGTPFFLPLEDDLPAGRYTLRLEPGVGCRGAHLGLSVRRLAPSAHRYLRSEAREVAP